MVAWLVRGIDGTGFGLMHFMGRAPVKTDGAVVRDSGDVLVFDGR